ncbi:MAG TPA: NAD(P)/FAD-dependent oxidoreductase [Gammaproteobacteria bacterium]|nr:NAD(P)/FAD-dependent oxidoreductase [Gammaproteobacteria bacterium]
METANLLFTPGHIGKLTMKNRLIMAPMVRNYADEHGRMSERYLAHLERIAKGGVGTMILEASFVSPEGRGFRNELGLHSDAVISGLHEAVKIAHDHGARIGIQLYHAGRQTTSKVSGEQPVAPSAIPCPLLQELPRMLDRAEIHALVRAFANGARRAKAAGMDFVEIHAAHGYLITQFLSPFSNRRPDAYGGSVENRRRFLSEIIDAVRKEVGNDYPITVRISADEMVPGGLTQTDSVDLALWLETKDIAAVHVSAGNYGSYTRGQMIPPMAIKDAPLVTYASHIKRAVRIPVIAVGKLHTPALAESLLQDGHADFIALGRELLADPDWPRKAEEGLSEEIHHCIACNQGCISRLFEQRDVQCTVNPACGRESQFAEFPHDDAHRKVLIAGAGPAGMTAARYAARAGFQVILCEAGDEVGGQLHAAAAAPHRPGWAELLRDLRREMTILGVDVRLNTRVDKKLVLREMPYAVILATGAEPMRPDIPGIGEINVVTARDLLEGNKLAFGSVLVVGGGCAGAQTAEFLANKGHAVTIVEAEGDIAADAPLDDRTLLLGRLKTLGVKIMAHTRLLSIDLDAINLQSGGDIFGLSADTVVLCLGSHPVNKLEAEILERVPHVFTVGDAVRARKVTDATLEGALAALGLSRDAAREPAKPVKVAS